MEIDMEKVYEHQFVLTVQKPDFKHDMYCYLLGRKVNGSLDIFLMKSIRDEQEFNNEVESIKKIFDPIVL